VRPLPLRTTIIQGSEPHSFRIDMTLAVTAAIGDTANCALVSTHIQALTYYNGGQPNFH
jgi:hypothetical protein